MYFQIVTYTVSYSNIAIPYIILDITESFK